MFCCKCIVCKYKMLLFRFEYKYKKYLNWFGESLSMEKMFNVKCLFI